MRENIKGKLSGLSREDRESLAAALERLRHEQFDVLLLDLSLPDSAGRETFLRARAEAPHLPIVVMTGMADQAVAVEVMGKPMPTISAQCWELTRVRVKVSV